jgi:glycosyltransferase involved in cell wall biosynthesis
MDYVIREVAALPVPRPFLVMLGHMDEASPPILALAQELLGNEGYVARSVPYAEVPDYYAAADVFTLGSLKEGFGRVYLEALIGGLPCIVHDDPVMRYVLGDEGVFGDFTHAGGLSRLLGPVLAVPPELATAARRREAVRSRFGWNALAPAYLEMFRACRER